MNKLNKIESRFGYIEIYTNEDRNILYAIPNGYVGPNLVRKDLAFLKIFDTNCEGKWKYIVDTSKAKIVNPINPFLLKGLKQFPNMSEYIVYAPNSFVRTMLKLTSWINQPHKIIKEEKILQIELNNFTNVRNEESS